MAAPRFRPVELVANPRHFGRVEHPQLAHPQTLTAVEAGWALIQHRAAYTLRLELAAAGETVDDLATRTGQSPTWVRRKMTGQTPFDFADLVTWTLLYGVQVWPVIDSVKDLAA